MHTHPLFAATSSSSFDEDDDGDDDDDGDHDDDGDDDNDDDDAISALHPLVRPILLGAAGAAGAGFVGPQGGASPPTTWGKPLPQHYHQKLRKLC
jgi:hypothetical protein